MQWRHVWGLVPILKSTILKFLPAIRNCFQVPHIEKTKTAAPPPALKVPELLSEFAGGCCKKVKLKKNRSVVRSSQLWVGLSPQLQRKNSRCLPLPWHPLWIAIRRYNRTVSVKANATQGDDGGGAEHDIKGDPYFAEFSSEQPQACHFIDDTARRVQNTTLQGFTWLFCFCCSAVCFWFGHNRLIWDSAELLVAIPVYLPACY